MYVLDIYAAGEQQIKNINSKNLVKRIGKKNVNVFYLNKKTNIKLTLNKYYNDNNTIIFMGAGSVTSMAYNLFKKK